MKKIIRLTERDLTRLVSRVIKEQSISKWASNLSGELPGYWKKLKNMNPKPIVKTSNLLQKTLGSSSEMLEWNTKSFGGNNSLDNSLGVHSDGTVEIIIQLNDVPGKEKKQIGVVNSILKSIGLTGNWEGLHDGGDYVELENLNQNQIFTLVNNASKYI